MTGGKMSSPALVLFDDQIARDWMPFALTRPIGELRFGAMTLRERAERVFGLQCIGHIGADHLLGFEEPGAPPVLDQRSLPTDRDLVFISSRAVPAWGGGPIESGSGPALIRIGGALSGWYTPAGTGLPSPDLFLNPEASAQNGWAEIVYDGAILDRLWRMIGLNADQLTRDLLALFTSVETASPGPGIHLLGEAPLIVDPSATIEPGVVIDLREGPVWIDEGALVGAFTKLTGPAYIGQRTRLLGGKIGEVSIGPVCRIHGEVESSIVLGYSNKSHDGFIGHAYIGRWVNLGAMTTNSDLKNNYGPVRIWTPRGEEDTGEQKLGCFLGDHVKTAIGTLLNTGTVVGAGSNLFGAGFPPRYVPPFTWGTGKAAAEYDLERFLAATDIIMARRDLNLTSHQRAQLEAAWILGRGEI
jgi:UDP-N-acetylglucosamine diphosphorylase/glucosamine-1-phosphate N-acetyltransferase